MVTDGAKLVLQLAAVGVLGGLAQLLLAERDKALARRERDLDALKDFRNRLHGIAGQVVAAREALRASATLDTYNAQVSALVIARNDLDALVNDIGHSGDRVPEAR
jgi:hypothetical protein